MFKFGFEIDDADVDDELDFIVSGAKPHPTSSETIPDQKPCQELSLNDLLHTLPPSISYSPIFVPIEESEEKVILARRDLFDARFQVISQANEGPSEADNEADLAFFDDPSDLVPNVYEGGLKTWECSLDLVNYLRTKGLDKRLHGKRIVEFGCGTAVPSLYVLQQLFSASPSEEKTEVHLQDYNQSVISLVTLPNIIFAWYFSPASSTYRSTSDESEDDSHQTISTPGDIDLTPELKAAFLASLSSLNISLRLFCGSWETFPHASPYDIVLTSETIYRPESLPSLVGLLRTVGLGDRKSVV